MEINKDKALGMLIGLHVGDCLGIPLEFKSPITDKSKWVTEITGGGEFEFPKGVGSDDTDLMLCILRSLVKNKGEVVMHDIARNFVLWKKKNPPDIGNATRWGIKNIEDGVPLDLCGISEDHSQGNGSIMRCAPLALIPVSFEDITSQASLTHAHQNCIDVDSYFIRMLQSFLCVDNVLPKMYINQFFKDEEVIKYLETCHEQKWEELPTGGWCVYSLGAAIWAMYNCDSFEEGLISVVNRGDDSDSTGAVTGALLGAKYGYEAIPKRWVDTLKSADEIKSLLKEIV